MPDDLISKFYSEDLTEAEEQALSERLLSSTDDALRFGEKAEGIYLGYGLPDPKWHGSSPNHGTGGGHTGSSATTATHHTLLHHISHVVHLGVKHWVISSAIATVATTSAVVVHHELKRAQAVAPPVVISTPAVVIPSPTVVPTMAVKKAVASTKAIAPSLTPVNVSENPNQSYSNLSVVIRRATPGEVVVRVLNAGGEPIVLLYKGLLQTGSWGFDWDGKLENGETAAPGMYQIQVESGSISQKKNIVIR